MKGCVGIIGLGSMGASLALNLARNGYRVSVYNRTFQKAQDFVKENPDEGFVLCSSLEDLSSSLPSPRVVMSVITAGTPTKATFSNLSSFLEPGDLAIDCANSFYKDSMELGEEMGKKGILFADCGVSGGKTGALMGPSMMFGGSMEAWKIAEGMIKDICAKTPSGLPCAGRLGPVGSGHFVKMVHNGIEYALMGAIAEVCDIFRTERFSYDQCAEIFRKWDEGSLHGYLTEITYKVLSHKDAKTGKSFVEIVSDKARMNGTGTWTVLSALELGCSVPSIAEAVFERIFSSESSLRSALLRSSQRPISSVDSSEVMQTLYLAFASIFSQGLDLLLSASKYGWDLDIAQIAQIWEAGCIIRSSLLPKICSAFKKHPHLPSLMADSDFKEMEEMNEQAMRRVVAKSVLAQVPCAVLDSALSYLDDLSHPLSSNLISAQRDYFGAHGYERTDEEGFFHTEWENGEKEVKRQ